MSRVLLTGMSGTGKSTVLRALSSPDTICVDLDESECQACIVADCHSETDSKDIITGQIQPYVSHSSSGSATVTAAAEKTAKKSGAENGNSSRPYTQPAVNAGEKVHNGTQ